jgi:hypothetical protein
LEEDLATSSSKIAEAPTVNFLLGRQEKRKEGRDKTKRIQVQFRKNFMVDASKPWKRCQFFD